MNYYSHHIGDFNNATRHLTRVERSIYRDMMDLYYDTEEPLTLDTSTLCRKLLARTEEESTAVQQVLNEFFNRTEQGWHHSRCESVIEEFRTNTSAKSAAGKASAAKREAERLANLNISSTGVQQPLDDSTTDVQLTIPHSPLPIPHLPEKEEPPEKPKRKPDATATRLPADWLPSDGDKEFCKTERPDLDPDAVAARFRDYWHGIPGAKGRKLDWHGTWRNWVRNERLANNGPPDKFDPTAYVNRNRNKP